MLYVFLIGILIAPIGALSAPVSGEVLKLKVGFVKKFTCEGRLFVSAVGNDRLVSLEALPKELGCAVILKPAGAVGVTNLVLETSAGSIEKQIEVISK